MPCSLHSTLVFSLLQLHCCTLVLAGRGHASAAVAAARAVVRLVRRQPSAASWPLASVQSATKVRAQVTTFVAALPVGEQDCRHGGW
jgi:hypothetical protein